MNVDTVDWLDKATHTPLLPCTASGKLKQLPGLFYKE